MTELTGSSELMRLLEIEFEEGLALTRLRPREVLNCGGETPTRRRPR